ncbi:MAG: CinA family protein [Oligoflexia bacterium]|nr:CinA family protein [Oligoflexia bacterium]
MGTQNLVKKLATQFVKQSKTLGFAESCTGGKLCAAVTSVSGSSKYFLGGLVCYANQTKHDLLGVNFGAIKIHGAVSKAVAMAMAKGAKKRLKVDWAVSVTGIAGPKGGSKTKPVGLVFFAVAGPKVVRGTHRIFKGSRGMIQKQAVDFALKLLLKNFK